MNTLLKSTMFIAYKNKLKNFLCCIATKYYASIFLEEIVHPGVFNFPLKEDIIKKKPSKNPTKKTPQ